MSAHTPGPWALGFDSTTSLGQCHLISSRVGGWHDVAHVAEANARLIAAAPELLAALKRLLSHYDVPCEACNFAHDVIAKAEGKE